MGLFYAYLKDDKNDFYRYLITFVSREAADEWWRMISTPPSPFAGNVGRISPQFYTHNSRIDVTQFFSHPKLTDARQFYPKMFFAYISNQNAHNPMAIPPTEVTDHISGQWYFIRSKADPYSYWYFRTDDDGACLVCEDTACDAIHASCEYRTKFCVRVHRPADSPQVSEDFVMIGKDDVSITAPVDYILHIDGTRSFRAAVGYRGETDLLFSDLKNRFITRTRKQVNGEIWQYVVPVERGLGEAWELFDGTSL